jgi:hypothetical protein
MPRRILWLVEPVLDDLENDASTNSICWLKPTVAKTRRVRELKKVSAISESWQSAIREEYTACENFTIYEEEIRRRALLFQCTRAMCSPRNSRRFSVLRPGLREALLI